MISCCCYFIEELGTKFQTVVYKKETADYEGIISVENKVLDDENLASLVYWVTGAAAGCANKFISD